MGNKSSKDKVEGRVKAAARSRHLNVSQLKLEELPWGHLVSLRLVSIIADNNRLKEVPEELGRFSDIKIANFSHNRLTSVSPDAFPGLTACKELNLSHNRLTSLPITLGLMASLRVLSLAHNAITSLPDAIFEGPLAGQLRILNLSNNALTALPSSVGRLALLESLKAADNALAALPAELGNCSKLAELDVSRNQLTKDSIPPPIFITTSLSRLHLDGNVGLPSEEVKGMEGFGAYDARHAALVGAQFDGRVALSLRDH